MSLESAPRRAESMEDGLDEPVVEVEDAGVLHPTTRRALLALMRGPYLRMEEKPKIWAALVANQSVLRSRLADVYLDLVVDRERGLAFVRNLEVEDAPKVVRAHALTIIDTVLALFLRRTLLAGQGSNRTFVGRDEIEDHVRGFQSLDGTDRRAFDKRIHASINKMVDNSILLRTADEERWEISPVLAMVFGADEVAQVTVELERLAAS